MKITKWPTVHTHRKAFEAGVLHLVQRNRIPGGLPLHPNPLPIYNFAAHDVVNYVESGTEPERMGWRYYAGGDSKASVSGDIHVSSKPRLTSLSYGHSASHAITAADALLTLTGVEGHYEPRLLQIPGLLIEAFWLKSNGQSSKGEAMDLVIPYHTLSKEVEPTKPYSIKDFMARVYPSAQKALKRHHDHSRAKV